MFWFISSIVFAVVRCSWLSLPSILKHLIYFRSTLSSRSCHGRVFVRDWLYRPKYRFTITLGSFPVEYSCSRWKRVTAVPCNGLRTLRRWCNYAALLHAVHSFCLLHIFIRFLRVRNSRWNFHLKTCWFHFLIAQSGSTSPSVLVQVPSWWFRRRGERVVASSTFVFLSERRCRLHIPGMKTLKGNRGNRFVLVCLFINRPLDFTIALN